eukprot:6203342-Pleurochrysis_carterae.AAC.1
MLSRIRRRRRGLHFGNIVCRLWRTRHCAERNLRSAQRADDARDEEVKIWTRVCRVHLRVPPDAGSGTASDMFVTRVLTTKMC